VGWLLQKVPIRLQGIEGSIGLGEELEQYLEGLYNFEIIYLEGLHNSQIMYLEGLDNVSATQRFDVCRYLSAI
jgi:hypothetical protein